MLKLSNDVYLANEMYRTNETIVGKWIDGKPIYRKILTDTHTGPYDGGVAHGLTNIDKIWLNNSASFIYNSSKESLPACWYYNSSDWARTWVNDYQVRFKTVSSYGTRTLYAVIEYTKTTD